MKWVNATELKIGQKVYGLNFQGRAFYSGGMKVEAIRLPFSIDIRHNHGDLEVVATTAKFLVKDSK